VLVAIWGLTGTPVDWPVLLEAEVGDDDWAAVGDELFWPVTDVALADVGGVAATTG
jgi:hypothetical protein